MTRTILYAPGIDVNIQNNVGDTALIWACEEGIKHVVFKILDFVFLLSIDT